MESESNSSAERVAAAEEEEDRAILEVGSQIELS